MNRKQLVITLGLTACILALSNSAEARELQAAARGYQREIQGVFTILGGTGVTTGLIARMMGATEWGKRFAISGATSLGVGIALPSVVNFYQSLFQ